MKDADIWFRSFAQKMNKVVFPISTQVSGIYADKTVERGQIYFYKIRAKFSDRSWSEFSEVVSITIPRDYSSGDILFLSAWEQIINQRKKKQLNDRCLQKKTEKLC